MNKPKIWICSLQYSPIYKSHCCALGKQAEIEGYEVRYIFSQAYAWMLPSDLKEKTWFIGNSKGIVSSITDGIRYTTNSKIRELLKKDAPDFIYFYNFHPFLNFIVATLAKKNHCTFIQHVQEPYVEDKKIYRGFQQYWLRGFEYLQERLLKYTDIVVVSSERSRDLFTKRYPFFSKKILTIPLMYEDQPCTDKDIPERRYITFIGPPVPAKGPATLLNIVKYSNEHQYPYEFLLISRKKIDDGIYRAYPNLHVIDKDYISDDEMAFHLRRSSMVLTPYLVATQSSVVLNSLMFGTPALSSNVGGLPEFISHKKTGYLLNPSAPTEDWIEGIKYILKNFECMSEECRNYFLGTFSEINWPKYFKRIFNN